MHSKSKKILKRGGIGLLILFIVFISIILYLTKDDINADFSNIESILSEVKLENRNAGFAVSVFTKDSVLYQKGYGWADIEDKAPYTIDTRQYVASVSKTTIGIALLKAQELGVLSLDDPINKHVPFTVMNPAFPDETISIKHLATHTASLDYNENVVESLYISEENKKPSLSGFMEAYFYKKEYGPVAYTNSKPGTQFNYSNIGSGLAAYIIELTTNMSFAEFANQHIFNPLDLEATSWFVRPSDSIGMAQYYELGDDSLLKTKALGVQLYPARDLITSARDLTIYCQSVMNRSPQLLTSSSYEVLLANQLSNNVKNEDVDNMGIFWTKDRNQYGINYKLIGMNGGDHNINTMMWFDPKTEIGYIFIGNTGGGDRNRFNHIWTYNALVSLGDHYAMNDSKFSFMERASHKWHNIYSRFNSLF